MSTSLKMYTTRRYFDKLYVLLVFVVTIPILLVYVDISHEPIVRVNQPLVTSANSDIELTAADQKQWPSVRSIRHVYNNDTGNCTWSKRKEKESVSLLQSIKRNNLRGDINKISGPFVDIYQLGVYTFHNICIVDAPDGTDIPVQTGKRFVVKHLKAKQLVVYNSKQNLPAQSLQVNASWLKQAGEDLAWDVAYSASDIPREFEYISSHAAYFVVTSCEKNLYHFWEDHARDLHTALKLTGALQSSRKQQLFYQEPLRDILPIRNMRECTDPERFEPLLLALPLLAWHDTYHKAPHGTCYQNAVFGSPQLGAVPSEAEHYVIKQLQQEHQLSECAQSGGIVLIQRLATRQILNMDAIYSTILASGFTNVNIYNLEQLSVLEQLRIVHCSKVLIGVHGQALEWHVFMGRNTALVEIAWPRQHWPFFYTPRALSKGQVAIGVHAHAVELNWGAWVRWFHDIYRYAPAEDDVQAAFNGSNSYGDWGSIWRFANVKVPTKPFMKAFWNITQQIGLYPGKP